jgi:hypothetical protein
MADQRVRVLTWHIHGNYLWYLSQADCEFYIPFRNGNEEGYGGRGTVFPFGENVYEVPVERVREMDFDCILFQTRRNYFKDQYDILSESQRRLPSIYLEHDPPQEHPTDQRHWFDQPNGLLVHVTHFNALAWNSGTMPTRVIEHGVLAPVGVRYTGEIERGIVVINNLISRGRRLGVDIFQHVRDYVPLDLVGIAAEELGGLGAIPPPQLGKFISHYRFFFNPIRYTSLGLAVCEAMSIGLPIIGLATTEMATVVQNDVSGYVDTNIDALIARMQELLRDPRLAQRLSEGARRYALERFNIDRFAREWTATFRQVTGIDAEKKYSTAVIESEQVWANESR